MKPRGMRPTGPLAAAALILVGALASAAEAHAQEPPDTLPPDTVVLTARDSARIRIRERLAALARPPGMAPDTLADTLALRPGQLGASRSSGSAGAPNDSVAQALLALPGYEVTSYSGAAAEYRALDEVLILYGTAGLAGTHFAPEDTTPELDADSVAALRAALTRQADSLGAVADSLTTEAEALGLQAGRQLALEAGMVRARADSVRAEMPPLPGEEAEGEEGVMATLAGQGFRLDATHFVRYDERGETVVARGSPVLTPDEGDPLSADSLNFDVRGERASAFGAETRYAQGGGTNWRVTGDIPLVDPNVVYGHRTRFTSCELEVPHYHFETDELKIVRGSVLVAKSVKLYFADVPVFWLPFVAQSLSEGRASGLLTPRFSVNDIVRTSGGYQRRISNLGFYWAMSEYTDATMAFDWFDDNYIALTTSVRYRWLRQFLSGSVNVRQFWREGGRTERTLDTQSNWDIDERTNFRASIQYATSTAFVRRNSFDPREVTQQISSSGGLKRRFDWGDVNISGNRRQSLSDDKVDMTLPDLSISLKPMTFFEAPAIRAAWYNNLSWNGSGTVSRKILDRAPDSLGFSFGSADVADLRMRANSSLSLGAFSLGQGVTIQRGTVREVPLDSLVFFPDAQAGTVDIHETSLSWNASLGYQQPIPGTTITFTPSLSLSGEALRSDTMAVAQDWVSSPARMSFGAGLNADIYGMYPGVGPFEAIRHKVSPSFDLSLAPALEPTDLQRQVFGSRAVRPQRTMRMTLNQTWEAKEREDAAPSQEGAAGAAPPPAGEEIGVDDTPPDPGQDPSAPTRRPPSRVVKLLSLRTSAVSYDFVEADSLGFLAGFQTTRLTNQISSDFMRGLSVTMTHNLFEDVETGEGEGATSNRRFAPHLQSMNFGFALNPRSTVVRWLGLGGGGGGGAGAAEVDETADEPFDQRSATDETTMIPGRGTDEDVRESRAPARGGGAAGDWRASFSYALTRPRFDATRTSQMLQISVNLNPTDAWEMSWRTAYDLEASAFNDHSIRLTRDLHRWQAHFDFLQTATGNWTFRFEVSLLDNEDLKFDYQQRNLEVGEGRRIRPGG